MTATEIRSLIDALVMLVTAIGAVWAAVKSSKTETKVKDLGAEAQQTAAVADTKMDQIHVQTNSNLTALQTELALAKREIKDLHGVVSAIASDRSGGLPAQPALIVPTVAAPVEPDPLLTEPEQKPEPEKGAGP